MYDLYYGGTFSLVAKLNFVRVIIMAINLDDPFVNLMLEMFSFMVN